MRASVAFLVFFNMLCLKVNVCSSFRRTVGENIKHFRYLEYPLVCSLYFIRNRVTFSLHRFFVLLIFARIFRSLNKSLLQILLKLHTSFYFLFKNLFEIYWAIHSNPVSLKRSQLIALQGLTVLTHK